jgi:hypothetical protein
MDAEKCQESGVTQNRLLGAACAVGLNALLRQTRRAGSGGWFFQ